MDIINHNWVLEGCQWGWLLLLHTYKFKRFFLPIFLLYIVNEALNVNWCTTTFLTWSICAFEASLSFSDCFCHSKTIFVFYPWLIFFASLTFSCTIEAFRVLLSFLCNSNGSLSDLGRSRRKDWLFNKIWKLK